MTTTAPTITSVAIDTAAQAVSNASWGRLGGGFLVYDDTLTGGAWYSNGSRPDTRGCIVIIVPSGSVSYDDARHLVLASIPGYACRGCGATFAPTTESSHWCRSCVDCTEWEDEDLDDI